MTDSTTALSRSDTARAAIRNIRQILDDPPLPDAVRERPYWVPKGSGESFGHDLAIASLPYSLDLCPFPLHWWGAPSQTRFVWRPHAERRWPIWAGAEARRQEVFEPSDCFGESDIYLSPNEFFGWRKASLLSTLHAFWVEIDCQGHRSPTLLKGRLILEEVLSRVEARGISRPNLIVWSGRGWHLYWWINPVEAKPTSVRHWRTVADRLTSLIGDGKEWHCDKAASHDPCRVLRLPGSIHGSTGRHVIAYETGAERHTLEALANSVGVPVPAPVVVPFAPRKEKAADNDKPEQRGQRRTTSRSNLASWWGSVYFELRRFVRDNYNDQIPEGKRDLVLHVFCVAMAHFVREDEELQRRIIELGCEITDLPPEKIRQFMSTTIRTRYHYRADTLQALLLGIGISLRCVADAADRLEEREGKRCSSIDELRARQRQAAITTAHSRKSCSASRVKDAIAQLAASGARVTYAAIAKLTDLSERILQRLYLGIEGELRSLYLSAR